MQEYSPSDAAKINEKPVARKNVSLFNPEMTIRELLPDIIAKRDTIEGHINLSQQIVYVSVTSKSSNMSTLVSKYATFS